jgi:uncharacterized MAPEG superfamily protein
VTTELWLLFWSLPLYGLYLGTQAIIYRWHYGVMFAASGRDEPPKPEGVWLARAERALKNFLETWPAFVVLALIAHLADPHDGVVFWGAIVWYVGRIVYLPLYVYGVFGIRSLVWNVATIGLAMMFFGILF